MSEKTNNLLSLLMRFALYVSGFSLIFATPNLLKYGDFSHNKANLNAAITFIIIAVILYTVRNILSKKRT